MYTYFLDLTSWLPRVALTPRELVRVDVNAKEGVEFRLEIRVEMGHLGQGYIRLIAITPSAIESERERGECTSCRT